MAALPIVCGYFEWQDAEVFEREDAAAYLEKVHGILVPGGFGERGSEGRLPPQFCPHARCSIFWHLLWYADGGFEAARNLAGIEDASSTEFGVNGTPLIGLMGEWMKDDQLETRGIDVDMGGTMRLGASATCGG